MSPPLQPRIETPRWPRPGATGKKDGVFEHELVGTAFRVSSLARGRGLSVRQFRRRFHEQFEACPREMILETRMRLACGWILSEASLKAISLELGYRDPAHFCRAFCRFYGASPSQMRRELRKLTRRSPLMSPFGKRMSQYGK